ncbi:MAG: hypothetical protein HY982_01720 [Candidatus Magasanikbacteria bacterium]|nr:hypothetical protein [Candidatus Magasanikbacteria bacterium]
MKIIIQNPNDYARNLLRKCGYAAFADQRAKENSFVRRLSADFYPRFHVYAKENDKKLEINLHLDQKKPSYGCGTRAHAGEYGGDLVETEAERLKNAIEYLIKERREGE